MQGGEPCPCWLSTAVDSRCYLLITDISKGSYGLTDSVTDPLPTLFYLIMEHMVAAWCSTILNLFLMYFYIEFLTHFFCCFLMGQNTCFLLFSFFRVSNYLVFSNTVQLLRGTDVPHLPIHRVFFTFKKYQPDGFQKWQLYLMHCLKLKYHCKNASQVFNCLKPNVSLWVPKGLCVPSLY